MNGKRNIILLGFLSLLAGVLACSTAYAANPADLCRAAIERQEKAHQFPYQLMQAVAQVESGQWNKDSKKIELWPWTINAEGKSQRFESKAQAINAVIRLQSQGVKVIDVGCMQVNLHYHPDAFKSLDQAFDPEMNAAYAAKFLQDLYDRQKSWSQTIAHYHSATRKYNVPYKLKVFKTWNAIKRDLFAEKRETKEIKEAKISPRSKRVTVPTSSQLVTVKKSPYVYRVIVKSDS